MIVLRGDLSVLASLRFGFGDMLIVCAVLIWALHRAAALRPPIHALSFLALTFAIGVIAMAPLAVAEWRVREVNLTPLVLGGVAYVALLPSLAAYLLYNRAVAEIGAARAGQTMSLQPLLGALLAALFLREPFYGYHFAGMALIASGIVMPILLRPRGRA